MTDMTPAIKRAAEAAYPIPEDTEPAARAVRQVLREGYERGWRESREALLSDREGMTRVLAEHRARGFNWNDECRCGWPIPSWIDDGPDAEPIERPDRMAHYSHQADAIRAHLLGGEDR